MAKVTVYVSARVEVEYETEDTGDPEELASAARVAWRKEALTMPAEQLSVSVEPSEWADSGRFGTGPDATEEDMLARMQREAEEAAGLLDA